MAKNRKLVAWLLCSLILGFFVQTIYPVNSLDFLKSFPIIYGYLNFENQSALTISIIKWMIPQLILIFFGGDYIEQNLVHYLKYILTRTSNLKKYLFFIYVKLFAAAAFTCSILYILTAILCAFSGSSVNLNLLVIKNMVVYMLYLFFILLLVNSISIVIKAVYAVFITIGIQIIFFQITKGIFNGFISKQVYPLLPTSNILFYYNGSFVKGSELLYLTVAILVIFVLNIILLKKKEIM